jgi:hypothetical protein
MNVGKGWLSRPPGHGDQRMRDKRDQINLTRSFYDWPSVVLPVIV